MSRKMPVLAFSHVVLGLMASVSPTLACSADFGRDVQPLLAERCLRCHGPRTAEGGLRLGVRRQAMLGGDFGPAIVARMSERGALPARITAKDVAKRMPPSGKPLTDAQITLIKSWIDAGAHWPDELAGKETFG